MNQELEAIKAELEALRKKVAELEVWKRKKETQQLSEPLDYPSQQIVKRAAA